MNGFLPQLSGGEKQRVALARAFLKAPPILWVFWLFYWYIDSVFSMLAYALVSSMVELNLWISWKKEMNFRDSKNDKNKSIMILKLIEAMDFWWTKRKLMIKPLGTQISFIKEGHDNLLLWWGIKWVLSTIIKKMRFIFHL